SPAGTVGTVVDVFVQPELVPVPTDERTQRDISSWNKLIQPKTGTFRNKCRLN
ncbi:hypothetical protein LINGRAHAP2_LOCUS7714, partial [Linum grandiflorum]